MPPLLDNTDDSGLIVCSRADPSRYEDIVQLYHTDFHPDEAMQKALGTAWGRSKLKDDYYKSRMDENLSVMAVDELTGRVAGAAIVHDFAKENPIRAAMRSEIYKKTPKIVHIGALVRQLEERVTEVVKEEVLGSGSSGRILEVYLVVVSREYRGRGILRRMMTEAHRIARVEGFSAAITDATGKYSQQAFSSLGYRVMAEMDYADYTDENGVRVFEGIMDPEHKTCTIMGMKL